MQDHCIPFTNRVKYCGPDCLAFHCTAVAVTKSEKHSGPFKSNSEWLIKLLPVNLAIPKVWFIHCLEYDLCFWWTGVVSYNSDLADAKYTLFGKQSYCKTSTVGRRHTFLSKELYFLGSSKFLKHPLTNHPYHQPSVYLSPLSKPPIFSLSLTCSHASPSLSL